MDWMNLLIIAGIVALVFGLVIAGMAVGVIFSNRRIQGSCGGLGTMRGGDGKSPCMACGSSPTDCDEATRAACDDAANRTDGCDHETRSSRPYETEAR